ncbi:MAG: glutamate racemase [Bacteroidota bacterium]|nr:glutamate racemase [Bacteroidota bacterium]
MHNNQPIGIFDSGIGGLTVARSIAQALPNEQLIYFGDTAHLPYGEKSKQAIISYSEKIAEFLIEHGCKAIVIACNSASSMSYEIIRDKYKGQLPVISVIDPIIEAITHDDDIKNVGLIATKATIASGVYQEKLHRRKPNLIYSALATPLLAPMIEEGFFNHNISNTLINNYLQNEILNNIDALILGCTHYVMIKEEINAYYNHSIKLYDSTDIVSDKLKSILNKENLLSNTKKSDSVFYVSDFTQSFEATAKMFFGDKIKLIHFPLWS